HTLKFCPLPRGYWRRLGLLRRSRGEAAIIQRRFFSGPELWLLRRRFATLIFDFDDALWLRDSFSSKGLHSVRRRRRFETMLCAMDLIVAGNEFLADRARECVDSSRVVVIPTCIDSANYPIAAHSRTSGAQLVWLGSASTLAGMDQFAGTLNEIG